MLSFQLAVELLVEVRFLNRGNMLKVDVYNLEVYQIWPNIFLLCSKGQEQTES